MSIALAYLITLVLMMLLRRSVLLGLVSTIPIIFASVVMYGLLGIIKIPLDFAMMLLGPVSIGVGIDYTIHMIYVITDEMKRGKNLEDAISHAFQERGRAIISNTAAVMAGFGILLFSSMVILRSFGGIMVLSMLLCFIGALTVLPVVLLILRPRALARLANADKGGRHVD
jgi:predicted RND superfamily exporter protein